MAAVNKSARATRSTRKTSSSPDKGSRGPGSLLDAATKLLDRVLSFDQPMDQVLGEAFGEARSWGSRDRALLAEVVYRVVRDWATLKALLARSPAWPSDLINWHEHRRLALVAWPTHARDKLALPAALLPWLEAWSSLAAAGLPKDVPPEVRLNLPAWLEQALRAELGAAELAAWVQASGPLASLDLRVNEHRIKRAEVLRRMSDEGLQAAATPFSPWGIRIAGRPALAQHPLMREGLVEVQDEGSQLLALLVDARRGEMVADFCAGGGGKSLALGAAMRSSGRLYAMDTSAARLTALAPRAKRAGLDQVFAMAITSEHDARLERLAGKLDRVLVDAPCSGLGTLRRSPDLKWRLKPGEVEALVKAQASILAAAARLVKPGGRLVYATCSVLRAENEEVVSGFLQADPRFLLNSAEEVLKRHKVVSSARLVTGPYLRLWPQKHQTDGFFAAVFTRQD